MGMFDSLYDSKGREWQTKAFDCLLDEFRVGDPMPDADASTYQVAVLGGKNGEFIESFATVRDDVLEQVPATRDIRLALIDYCGGIIAAAKEA